MSTPTPEHNSRQASSSQTGQAAKAGRCSAHPPLKAAAGAYLPPCPIPVVKDYDPDRNSAACYELGIKAWREQCIRRKQIAPSTRTEQRWAEEGDVPPSKLETVRG